MTPIHAGTRAGQRCHRPVGRYIRNLLRGWDPCTGLLERRSSRVRCPRCGWREEA